jgi:hypothetical protein
LKRRETARIAVSRPAAGRSPEAEERSMTAPMPNSSCAQVSPPFDRMRRCEAPVASWRDVASAWLLVVIGAAALLTNVPLQLPHRHHQVQASSGFIGAAADRGLSPTGSPIASP